MNQVIAAVENVILIVIAVNTALLGQKFPAMVLIEDAGATRESVHMPLLRHNFTNVRHRLEKDAARNGGDEERALYSVVVDRTSL